MVDRIQESDVRSLENLYRQQGKVEVYKVSLYRTGEILCMKKIFVENVMDATMINTECITMAAFNHNNIIKLRGCAFGGTDREITNVVIFMEYFSEGDLEKMIINRIKSSRFFSEEELINYLKQLVSAYAYMEEASCAHRDIKPQNIFVTDGGATLKVADLGSAVKKDLYSGVTLTGTPLYLSPKLRDAFVRSGGQGAPNIEHDVYKSDVYSLGLTILYMASLASIKDLSTLADLENKIQVRINSLPQQYSYLKGILKEMLSVDENKRPDFIELRNKLSQGNVNFSLNENNLGNTHSSKIENLEAKCEICNQMKSEEEIYILTGGLICKNCYEPMKKLFYHKAY